MRSVDVCKAVGISFRRLDYLARTKQLDGMATGSGCPRVWDDRLVVRLALANRLASVGPQAPSQSAFQEVATAALDPEVPDPPRSGYALVTQQPSTVTWAPGWPEVQAAIASHGAVLLVAYDLDELVGQWVDLDALYAPTAA